MPYRLAADLVLVLHALFVVFVLLGGLLVLYRHRFLYLHLPAAVWGALVEFRGWVCPLTPLEQALRRAAGAAGYEGGFIEHYLVAVLYPASLGRDTQILLGGVVVAVNLLVYGAVLVRYRHHRGRP
ncbi:MAG TPA: DUF2784 family protein [Gammaproteobacteria bacterium]|nr:DUF2784 family protein [Gammaproteobacteria bacterium]